MPASTSLPVKPRPPIHKCSVNNERQTRKSMQKPNDIDAPKATRCWKNSLCIAFLLIPALGKSGCTLFLIIFINEVPDHVS